MTELSLGRADSGSSVPGDPGDELVIRLPESPTTGYRWAADACEGVTEEASMYASEPATPAVVGGGGTRVFRFRVERVPAAIHLKRWREWEGDASVDDRFTAHVIDRDRR